MLPQRLVHTVILLQVLFTFSVFSLVPIRPQYSQLLPDLTETQMRVIIDQACQSGDFSTLATQIHSFSINPPAQNAYIGLAVQRLSDEGRRGLIDAIIRTRIADRTLPNNPNIFSQARDTLEVIFDEAKNRNELFDQAATGNDFSLLASHIYSDDQCFAATYLRIAAQRFDANQRHQLIEATIILGSSAEEQSRLRTNLNKILLRYLTPMSR